MKKTIITSALIITIFGLTASSASAMTLSDVLQLNAALKQEASSAPAVLGATSFGDIPNSNAILPDGGPVKIKQALRYANNGSPMILKKTLKYGTKNSDEVKVLQAYLNASGYDLPTTGYFGPMTKKAVISYQKANGLGADGIPGPNTMGTITADISASTTQ